MVLPLTIVLYLWGLIDSADRPRSDGQFMILCEFEIVMK